MTHQPPQLPPLDDAASPTPPVQPAVFTLDELVDACVAAEVPDSKFEALSIYLTAAQAEGGASEPQ
jgi:hypothetical protein